MSYTVSNDLTCGFLSCVNSKLDFGVKLLVTLPTWCPWVFPDCHVSRTITTIFDSMSRLSQETVNDVKITETCTLFLTF